MKKPMALVTLLALVIILLAFELVLIPLLIQAVLGWFGVGLTYLQCLVITILFNIMTYGFRKR